MHHDLSLLLDITMALLWAFVGGMAARRLGLPSLVGYLAAGVAIGPFTPGFVGDPARIGQLAELGVIFLMFGVGLHFSLQDLWAVRKVAIPGALFQMAGAAFLAFFLGRSWGWSDPAALTLGLAASIASTVVLLRGLMDNGLLNTRHGRVAVGWLVLEDLATILILVLLPPFFTGGSEVVPAVLFGGLKAVGFVFLMLVVGSRFLPWLLARITFAASRELFLITVVAVVLGTAVGSAELFGVSLALGAFLGGVVLGRTGTSHHIGAQVAPFRDLFTVLFFVSVGMLVNPSYVLTHGRQELELTALIVVGKTALPLLLGFILPAQGRTMLVVAAGLSQIGEFSFIVGQTAVELGILTKDQYSLILVGAVLSIMLNPFMFRAIGPLERALRRFAPLWRLLERNVGVSLEAPEPMAGHVVVVGCGRVGGEVIAVLRQLGIAPLVVENDPERMAEMNERGVPLLYGDAANSEILEHASLEKARAVVVTVSDEAAAEIVVGFARRISPNIPVIARGMTAAGVERLARTGASVVIHPELEGGLEIMRHTLLFLGMPAEEVQKYADAVRRGHYDFAGTSPTEHRLLAQMTAAVQGMEVVWLRLEPGSPLVGETLAKTALRRRFGLSAVAVIREGEILPNPDPATVFREGDTVGLLGAADRIAAAEPLFASGSPKSPQEGAVSGR